MNSIIKLKEIQKKGGLDKKIIESTIKNVTNLEVQTALKIAQATKEAGEPQL